MVEVRHQRELHARASDLAEQVEQVFSVIVVDEAVRPIGDRLGSDPDSAQVVTRVGLGQRLDVFPQCLRLHDQRITAGEEHVGDFVMLSQVAAQALALAHRELLAFQPHELGPAEAERAVGVTGLPLRGKEQDRLAVLVLHSLKRHPVQLGHVVLHLAGGMRIQGHPNLIGDHLQFAGVLAAVDRRRHRVEVRR